MENVNRKCFNGPFHAKSKGTPFPYVPNPLHLCYRPINSAINPYIHPFIHPSVRRSVRPSIDLSIHQPIRPFELPSIHPSIHPSINTCRCSPVFRREYLTWKQITTLQNRSCSGSTGLSALSSSVPSGNCSGSRKSPSSIP